MLTTVIRLSFILAALVTVLKLLLISLLEVDR